MKKTIYMNPPLERLADKTKGDSRRTSGFSAALGEIVGRYDIIMELTPLPDFSDAEIEVLSEIVCGSVVDKAMIRCMHLSALDCASGTPELRQAVADNLSNMSAAERMAVINHLGQ